MDNFSNPPRQISRKPVAYNNEGYALSPVPQSFANVPLTSIDERDATNEQRHPSVAPLMGQDDYNHGIPGKDSSSGWQSQPFKMEQKELASRELPLLGAMRDWKVETACCFLGVVSLAAIAATLAPFQGRPLPQLPYDISLNSLISLYVIMLKAAMFVILCSGLGQLKWTWFGQTRPLRDLERFDEASRGALGAFKLIWALRGRNILVTLGSLITVVAIAIDPFAQQIVRYSSCEQVSSISQASIPRTNLFSNSGIHIGANLDSVDLGMQSAVNVGIFSPGSVQIPFTCDTGNCTFPHYRSFAYCSTCRDISSEVMITKSNTTVILTDNSTYTNEGALNFTLPSGLWASQYQAEQFAMGPGKEESAGKIQALLGDSNGPYQNGNTTMLTFACVPPNLEWGCRGYGASECSLDICIKTYTASIENGKLNETELYSEPAAFSGTNPKNNESGSEYLSTIDMSCVNAVDVHTLEHAGYTWNDTTKWLGYYTPYPVGMSTEELTSLGFNLSYWPVSTINTSCVYQTATASVQSLSFYFASVFQGSAGEAPEALGGTSDLISAMFNSGNVSDITLADSFKNVSTSITNFIRQNGDPWNSKVSLGRVLLTETCVDVRWAWLTFPAALFAFTLVFFVGMVIRTTSRYALFSGSHDFKSFALPLVFTELETRVPQGVQQSRFGMVEMYHEASTMNVRLSKTEGGWKFVKDD